MSGARATGWPCRTARRAGRTLAALAGLAGGLGALVVGTPTVAAAYPTSTVVITGHGWGHGIGMGQWGALGYAIGDDNGDGNWTWQQIVTHFYGGTTIQTVGNDSQNVSVAMTENNGNDLIATAPGGVSRCPEVRAARRPSSSNRRPTARPGASTPVPGCGGTNGSWRAPVATGVTAPDHHGARRRHRSQLCLAGSLTCTGTLLGTYNSNAAARTVNLVPWPSTWATWCPASPRRLGHARRAGAPGRSVGLPGARGPGGGRPLLCAEHHPGRLRRLRRHL